MSFIGVSPVDVLKTGAVVKQGVTAFKTDDGSKSQYQEIRHGHNSRIQALQNFKAFAESSDASLQTDAAIMAVEKFIAHDQKQQARLEKYDNSLGPDAALSFRQAIRVLQFSFSGAKQHRDREAQLQSASTAATLDAILISQKASDETLAEIIAAKDEINQQTTASGRDLSGKLDTISSVLCDVLGRNQQKLAERMTQSSEQLAVRLETALDSESTRTREELTAAIESVKSLIATNLSAIETVRKQQQDASARQEYQIKELMHRMETANLEANSSPPIPAVVGGLHSLRILCAFNSWCSYDSEALSSKSKASNTLRWRCHVPGTIYVAYSPAHAGLKIGCTSKTVDQRLREWHTYAGIRYIALFQIKIAAAFAADILLWLELRELDIKGPAKPVIDRSGRHLREQYDMPQEWAVRIVYQVCELLNSMDLDYACMYVERLRDAMKRAKQQNPWR